MSFSEESRPPDVAQAGQKSARQVELALRDEWFHDFGTEVADRLAFGDAAANFC